MEGYSPITNVRGDKSREHIKTILEHIDKMNRETPGKNVPMTQFYIGDKLGIPISGAALPKLIYSVLLLKHNAVPVIVNISGKRKKPIHIRVLTDEEYKDYKFTHENFQALSDSEISSIEEKIKSISKETTDKEIDTATMLKLLTIADIIAQSKNDEKPMKINVFYNIIPESRDGVNVLLGLLVKSGVIRLYDKDVIWEWNTSKKSNQEQHLKLVENNIPEADTEKVPEKTAKIVELEIPKNKTGFEELDFFQMASCMANKYAEAKSEILRLQEELETERKKAATFDIMNAEYKRLSDENEKLKADIKQFTENIKDMKALRSKMENNIETVLSFFVSNVTKQLGNFEASNEVPRVKSAIMEQCIDAKQSLMNTLRKF